MRKIIVLAAMMAMMLALASPAFAHAVAVDGGVDLQFVDASQSATVDVTQSGDASATSGLGGAASASVDNSLDVSVTQVNAGVGGGASGDDLFVDFPFVIFF